MGMLLGSGIDSTVFLEETEVSVLKMYRSHITLPVLQEYHRIHNHLAQQEFWFDWNPEIDISYTITGIKKVTIQVLELGNEIFEDEGQLCTRIRYVEGNTFSSYGDEFKEGFLKYMRAKYLSFQLKDINLTFGGIEKLKQMGNPGDFSPTNIKIGSIESGNLRLIVTDLGTYIPFFVHCYKERVEKLL